MPKLYAAPSSPPLKPAPLLILLSWWHCKLFSCALLVLPFLRHFHACQSASLLACTWCTMCYRSFFGEPSEFSCSYTRPRLFWLRNWWRRRRRRLMPYVHLITYPPCCLLICLQECTKSALCVQCISLGRTDSPLRQRQKESAPLGKVIKKGNLHPESGSSPHPSNSTSKSPAYVLPSPLMMLMSSWRRKAGRSDYIGIGRRLQLA